MAAIRVRVAENGRMSLPASVRRQLGLEGGGELLLQVEGGEVRMTTRSERVRRVQARMRELARGKPVSVEDFLAWKREQAALEEAEADVPPAATDRTA